MIAKIDDCIAMSIGGDKRLQFLDCLHIREMVEFDRILLRIEVEDSVGTDAWRKDEIIIAGAADRHRDGLALVGRGILRIGETDVVGLCESLAGGEMNLVAVEIEFDGGAAIALGHRAETELAEVVGAFRRDCRSRRTGGIRVGERDHAGVSIRGRGGTHNGTCSGSAGVCRRRIGDQRAAMAVGIEVEIPGKSGKRQHRDGAMAFLNGNGRIAVVLGIGNGASLDVSEINCVGVAEIALLSRETVDRRAVAGGQIVKNQFAIGRRADSVVERDVVHVRRRDKVKNAAFDQRIAAEILHRIVDLQDAAMRGLERAHIIEGIAGVNGENLAGNIGVDHAGSLVHEFERAADRSLALNRNIVVERGAMAATDDPVGLTVQEHGAGAVEVYGLRDGQIRDGVEPDGETAMPAHVHIDAVEDRTPRAFDVDQARRTD